MTVPNTHTLKMRGENMTRIETFVAAAFALTMLVISLGAVPETMQEFVEATKQISAFQQVVQLLCGFGIHTHYGAGVRTRRW
ncbi:MAG: hypothetical protein ACJAV1_003849 [Paraglaciecola sp.]|jgi:hypothetical protein